MKILVVSDTHRYEDNLEKVLKIEKADMLFHLGDIEGSENKIESMANVNCVMVRGNNDFFSFLDDERELEIKGYKILLTHGHLYNVGLSTQLLYDEASSRGFDLAIFGHTHRPFYKKNYKLILLNPGSISYPRQEGRKASYAIINIDEETNALDICIKYLLT